MAHNLATIDGRIAMAYSGKTPWHGLGLRVPSITSVEMALSLGNLNWTVSKHALYLQDGRQAPDVCAILRDTDNAILGTPGDGFTPIQNSDAFNCLREACASYGVTIETVGALGNGARTWMLAKLPDSENFEVVPGDTVKGYFLVQNGHDGKTTHSGLLTPIRVVCQNTLTQANTTEHATAFRFRHTVNVGTKVAEAEKLVSNMIKAMKSTGETFAKLAEKRWNPAKLAEWISSVLPADLPKGEVSPRLQDKRAKIASLAFYGKGANLAGADAYGTTAWMAYNALCEYIDHVRPAESKSASGLARANESALFGSGADLKASGLSLALRLAA